MRYRRRHKTWLRLASRLLLSSAFLLAAAPVAAQRPPQAPEAMRTPSAVAHAAINFAAQGCLRNLGSAANIENWARGQNLGPARPDVAAFISSDAANSVWVLQMDGINITMVFPRDGLQCRVYAQGADVDVALAYFIGVMEGVRHPGVIVEKEQEGEQVQGLRRVWQIGYRVR